MTVATVLEVHCLLSRQLCSEMAKCMQFCISDDSDTRYVVQFVSMRPEDAARGSSCL